MTEVMSFSYVYITTDNSMVSIYYQDRKLD
jgi:hypothetical protein